MGGDKSKKKRKKNRLIIFFYILFLLCYIALTITLPLTTKANGINVVPNLNITQTQTINYGTNDMLNAGDIIEIRTTIANMGSQDVFNITVLNNLDLNTICLPNGMNNMIEIIQSGDSVECYAFHVITQMDIDDAEFVVEFTATNDDDFVFSFESFSNLTQTTFGALDVSQSYEYEIGPDFLLSPGDLMTVTVKIINVGTETILNLTSSNYGNGVLVESFEPMQMINFTYVYTITQSDVDNLQAPLNEIASGIGITTANAVSETNQIFASLTEFIGELRFTETLSYGPECANVGGIVTITLTAENIGTGALTDVFVADTLAGTSFVCGPMGVDNNIGDILPQASYTCTGAYMLTSQEVMFGFNTTLNSTATGTALISAGTATTTVVVNTVKVLKGQDQRYLNWNTAQPYVVGYSSLNVGINARFESIVSGRATSCAIGVGSIQNRRRWLGGSWTNVFSNIQVDPLTLRWDITFSGLRAGARLDLITNPPQAYQDWDVVVSNSVWDPAIGRVTSTVTSHSSTFTLTRSQMESLISLNVVILAVDGDFAALAVRETVVLQ